MTVGARLRQSATRHSALATDKDLGATASLACLRLPYTYFAARHAAPHTHTHTHTQPGPALSPGLKTSDQRHAETRRKISSDFCFWTRATDHRRSFPTTPTQHDKRLNIPTYCCTHTHKLKIPKTTFFIKKEFCKLPFNYINLTRSPLCFSCISFTSFYFYMLPRLLSLSFLDLLLPYLYLSWLSFASL